MNKVVTRIQRADTGQWELVAVNKNLRTNDGINWQSLIMGSGYDSTGVGSIPNQVAITEDTTAPASSTTNLLSEIAADGLSRETATYTHTADSSSYTQTAEWQYTGGSTVTVATAAMCSSLTDDDLSIDTHFVVTAVSPVAVLNSNDTLEIQWGIFY